MKYTYAGNFFLVPWPHEIITAMYEIIKNDSQALIYTCLKTLIAFCIGSSSGVILGVFFGMSARIYSYIHLPIDFFRSIPALAFFPAFLLIFGISDSSKIALATFSCMIICLFHTSHGLLHKNPLRQKYAQTLNMNYSQLFFKIHIWDSLPETFIGLKNSISMALIVIVVTEMFIGAQTGLGKLIIDFQITYSIAHMYAAIALVGFLGFCLNTLLESARKKVVHWSN